MARNITSEVAVRLTLSGTQEVKAGLEDVKGEIDDLKLKKATISIDANSEDWQAKYEEALAEAKALGLETVSIKIKGDTSSLKDSIAEASAMLAATEGLSGRVSGSSSGPVAEAEKLSMLSTLLGKGGTGNAWKALIGGGAADVVEGGGESGGILSMLASPLGLGGALGLGTGLVAAASPVLTSALGMGVGAAGAFGAYELGSKANTTVTTDQSAINALVAAIKTATGATKLSDEATLQKDIASLDAFKKQNAGVLGVYSGVQGVAKAGESVFTNAITGGGSNSFASGLSKIFPQIQKFITSEGPALQKMFQASLPFVSMLVKAMEDFASHALPAVTSAMEHLKPYMPMMQRFWDAIGTSITAVIRALGWLAGAFLNAIRIINDGVRGMVSYVKEDFDEIVSVIKRMVSGAASGFSSFRNTMSQWVSDIGRFISNAVHWFTSLPGRIRSALGNAGSWLVQTGRDIISGLINGLDSAVGGLLGRISQIASDVSGAFKKVLGIFSPSRVFAEHGKNIVEGLVQGIDSSSHMATQSVSNLASNVARTGATSVAGHGSAASGNVTINMNGIITNPDATARQIQQLLSNFKRHNGGRELGLA